MPAATRVTPGSAEMRRTASSTKVTVFGPADSMGSGTSIASTCATFATELVVCRASKAASSMPAPTSSTNEKATCAVAKSLSRRLVPGVMRRPPVARLTPADVSDAGKRGIQASSTAAAMARPAPTHSRLASMVTSSARTEKRAAKRATAVTSGPASSTPSTAPAPHKTRLSASSVRRSAPGLAPRAARTASSPSRRIDRARIRLATFEQATMNTTPAVASSSNRMVRAGVAI